MRYLFSVVAMFLAMSLAVPVASARDATPASGLADAGLPELDVTMTTTAYEGIPDEVDAGRYLVSVTIEEGASEFGGGIAFVQPPEGMTAQEFVDASIGAPDESGVGDVAATPVEGAESSPESDGEMSGIPGFVFDATYAGGTYSFGGSTEVILDLTPGEWIAWADDPSLPQEPVVFKVTGDMPADLVEPESAATITMSEYAFAVTDGELTSGSQTVRIDNAGGQPHFVGWFLLPDGTTEEEIEVVLDEEAEAEMTGTPAAYSGINPDEDLMPVVFTATQSSDTSIWITVDLEVGTHGLVCFFPDMSDGMPHAYHGMYEVVEVAA